MFLSLRNQGLQGSFPRGLQLCTAITSLDPSDNHLSGPLPGDVSMHLPYVTDLNLSYNRFSGEIPENISRRLSFVKFLTSPTTAYPAKSLAPSQTCNTSRASIFSAISSPAAYRSRLATLLCCNHWTFHGTSCQAASPHHSRG